MTSLVTPRVLPTMPVPSQSPSQASDAEVGGPVEDGCVHCDARLDQRDREMIEEVYQWLELNNAQQSSGDPGSAASAPESCALSRSESPRCETYKDRTVLAPDGFPVLKTLEERREVYSCGMFIAADMLVEMHRGLDHLKIRTPELLKRMIVAVEIHNNVCERVLLQDKPALQQMYTDSLSRIKQMTLDASRRAVEHCQNERFDEAIQIHRQVGICYIKCRNIPMVAVAYENIAKCALVARRYTLAFRFAARAVDLNMQCCKFDVNREAILNEGAIMYLFSLMGDCFAAGSDIENLSTAMLFFKIALRLYAKFHEQKKNPSLWDAWTQEAVEKLQRLLDVMGLRRDAELKRGLLTLRELANRLHDGKKSQSVFEELRVFSDSLTMNKAFKFEEQLGTPPVLSFYHTCEVNETWKNATLEKLGMAALGLGHLERAKLCFAAAHLGFSMLGCAGRAKDSLMKLADVQAADADYADAVASLRTVSAYNMQTFEKQGSSMSFEFTAEQIMVAGKTGLYLVEQKLYEDALFSFDKVLNRQKSHRKWFEDEDLSVLVRTAQCYLELEIPDKAVKYLDIATTSIARYTLLGKTPDVLDASPRWGAKKVLGLYYILQAWWSYLHLEDTGKPLRFLLQAKDFELDDWGATKWTELETQLQAKKNAQEQRAEHFANMFLQEIDDDEQKKHQAPPGKQRRKKHRRKKAVCAAAGGALVEAPEEAAREAPAEAAREAPREAPAEAADAGGADYVARLISQRLGLGVPEPRPEPDAAPDQASECCVCLSDASAWIFIPCGHVCVCRGCAESIMQSSRACPLCTQPATGAFQVFL